MGIRCLAEYIAKLNNINFNLQEQSIQFEEKMKMLDIFSEYLKKKYGNYKTIRKYFD